MKKAVVFTLGCKVNQCESQEIVNMLDVFGFRTATNLGYADLYIINSCSVTNEADKKSRQAIARVKKFNEKAVVVVIGCAVEKGYETRDNVELIGAKDKIEKLRKFVGNNFVRISNAGAAALGCTNSKMRPMIKIQDGCNRFCSYCIVPYLRGRSVSRPVDEIINEVSQYKNIAKEIVLAGIDIAAYDDLIGLIKELGKNFKNDFRFRLGSLEQSIITKEFLIALKENNFCEHFHLSLQSGSDSVLKRMNRHYTAELFLEKVHMIREFFPLAAITTDIIAGFPGETEEEFEATLNLINKAKFSNIHTFPFSARKGTKAFEMDGQLSPQIKKERANKIIEIAKQHRQDFLNKNIGQLQEVFVEENEGYTRNYIRLKIDGATTAAFANIKITKGDIIYE